jgi:integrase
MEEEKRKPGRPQGTTKGGAIHPLTEKELASFFAVARESKKDLFMFNLILFFGLRSIEAGKLKVENFDYPNLQITVQGRKEGRKRTYGSEEIPGDIWTQWKGYMKLRKAHPLNPYLFPHRFDPLKGMTPIGVQCAFKSIAKRAGISGHSVHDLRHTCGQRLALLNFSATRISRWLRQKNSMSAECYIGLQEDKELGRRAAEKMPIYQ